MRAEHLISGAPIAVALLALATAGLIWQGQSVQPRYEAVDAFPSDTPERQAFDRARASFGRDDRTALMVISRETPLDLPVMEALAAVTARLEARDDLEEVTSPTDALMVVRKGDDEVTLEPALPAQHRTPARLEAALEAFGQPPYRRLLLSTDRRVTVITAVMRPDRAGLDDRRALHDALKSEGEILASADLGLKVRIAGYPVQRVILSDTVRAESRRLYPWVLAALLAVLALAMRHLSGVLLPIAVALLAGLWTTGWMGVLGRPPSILGPAVYILVVVVGVSDSVHLLSRHREHMAAGSDLRSALVAACDDLLGPCLLTSLTTAIGFFALLLTDLPMIADFGVQVAMGILSAYVITFLLIPGCLLVAHRVRSGATQESPARTTWVAATLAALERWVSGHPRRIVAGAIALTCVAGVGIGQLQVNSPLLADLDPDHPIRETNRFMETHLSGMIPLHVLVEAPEGARLAAYDAARMGRVEALTARLRTLDGVLSATSPVDVLRQMAPLLPGVPREEVPGLLPTALLLAHEQVARWVDDEADLIRIQLFIENRPTAEALRLFDEVAAAYEETLGVPAEGMITGQGYLGQVINQRIVDYFQWSFLVALAAVFLVLMIALRSLRLAVVSLLCNAFPPVMVAGLMGFCGIDLRYTSALVLSVVFGLAVDDTIHFISQLGRGPDPVRRAFVTAGPGILLTSLVLGAGFAVLMLSDFQPNRVLGLLLGITAVTAVIADLVLLPALLRVTGRQGPAGAPAALS